MEHRTSWTGSRGRMLPLIVGVLCLRSDRHSFDECQRQQASAAQRCFDAPHMQEPNIPPLFQTMPKAASPFSFLDTRHPPGTGPDTLSEKPHISPCRTLQSSDRVWRTEKRPKHRGVSVTPGPPPATTWLPEGQQSPTHPSGAVVNRPVGDNSMGAAVNVHTGSRRAACGTMSVRAVRRLTGPARTAAPPRRVRDAGPNPRSIVWPSRCVC
jgi:hypothetical protein